MGTKVKTEGKGNLLSVFSFFGVSNAHVATFDRVIENVGIVTVLGKHGDKFSAAVRAGSFLERVFPQTPEKVVGVYPVSPSSLRAELASIKSSGDIVAAKIGAVGSKENIDVIAEFVADLPCPLVTDPVLAASDGTTFLNHDAWEDFLRKIGTRSTLLTPNRREAFALAGIDDPTEYADPDFWKEAVGNHKARAR